MRQFIVALMLMSCAAFAQDAQLDREQVDLNVLAGISTFTLDGQLKVFEAPMAAGLQYKGLDKDIDIGYYLAPVISEGELSNSSLSMMVYTSVYKDFGFGFGYRFWEAGEGVVPAKKSRLYLSFNFSLIGRN
jgi:hypothetical protein